MQGRMAPPLGVRGNIAAGSFDVVLEHQHAINLLVENHLIGSALVMLRPMYDSCIAGLWSAYVATDRDLEKFNAGNYSIEPQKVIRDLKNSVDKKYLETLQRLHKQSWKTLSNQVHGGNLQVSRRNADTHVGPDYQAEEIAEILTFSNLMAIIAAMQIPDLTNDHEFSSEIEKVINEFFTFCGSPIPPLKIS